MNTDTPAPKAREIRIKSPEPYDGEPTKWEGFWDSILLYLSTNEDTYDTDAKIIGFILSYMTLGSAESWRRNYLLKNTQANHMVSLTNKDQFIIDIIKEFKPTYSKETAHEHLKSMRQGNTSIDIHNINFKNLVTQAGLTTETKSVIALYQDSLRPVLLNKILSSEDEPVTINDWYEKATKFEKQYQRIQMMRERNAGGKKPTTTTTNQNQNPRNRPYQGNWRGRYNPTSNHGSYQRSDPNAMDTSADAISIDRMNMSPEKLDLMKKGACFNCKEVGHRANDCPKKKTIFKKFEEKKPEWKKPAFKSGTDAYAHIRAIMDDIGEEGRDEVFENFDKDF